MKIVRKFITNAVKTGRECRSKDCPFKKNSTVFCLYSFRALNIITRDERQIRRKIDPELGIL